MSETTDQWERNRIANQWTAWNTRRDRGLEYVRKFRDRTGASKGVFASKLEAEFPQLLESERNASPRGSERTRKILGTWYGNAVDNGYTEEGFERALGMVRLDAVTAWRKSLAPMTWRTDNTRCGSLEGETFFKFQVPYVLAFWLFMIKEGKLPTEAEAMEIWHDLNKAAMNQINLCPSLPGEERSLYDEVRANLAAVNPLVTHDEVVEHIRSGARFRCGKALASFARELHILASLAEGVTIRERLKKRDRHVPGVAVIVNPFLDLSGKIDIIGIADGDEALPCGVAVLLKSDRSEGEARRKAKNIPAEVSGCLPHIVCLPVESTQQDAAAESVFIPNDELIAKMIDLLGGDMEMAHEFQGSYTHLGPPQGSLTA